MARSDIIPIGYSGNCLEIIEALIRHARVPVILDDAEKYRGQTFDGVPILPMARMADHPHARFLCLVGSEKSYHARPEIIARTGLEPDRFATFVHPAAEVSGQALIGHGSVLYSGALVTSNGQIGEHVLIMPRALVHHDVTIGSFSIIGAGVIIAGGARLGECCYVGSGSAIRNGVTIGAGALIGMGSVVVKDVAPGEVVAGNPARTLRPAPR